MSGYIYMWHWLYKVLSFGFVIILWQSNFVIKKNVDYFFLFCMLSPFYVVMLLVASQYNSYVFLLLLDLLQKFSK